MTLASTFESRRVPSIFLLLQKNSLFETYDEFESSALIKNAVVFKCLDYSLGGMKVPISRLLGQRSEIDSQLSN